MLKFLLFPEQDSGEGLALDLDFGNGLVEAFSLLAALPNLHKDCELFSRPEWREKWPVPILMARLVEPSDLPKGR